MGTAIAAIFVFLMVILFHEFGHFIVAKLVGIKVHEFSIGMGPKLFQKQKGETDYSIRALPIGGYVRMEGEDENSDDPNSFNNKSVGERIAVVVAGAVMNFLLAIIVFSILSYANGMPTTIIQETIDKSPAYEAGLKSGDSITKINDKEIENWNSIVKEISNSNLDENMKITVLRQGQIKEFSLKPVIDKEENRMIIGIVPVTKKNFFSAIKGGFEKTGIILRLMFQFLGMVFRGKVTSKDLSGPVGVVYTIDEAAKYGFLSVLYIMGFISVNLGFFNLLPIPALDGSRILFLIIEFFRGKPMDPEKEGFVHFIGFVFLLTLMIYVTYSDIVKFQLFRR